MSKAQSNIVNSVSNGLGYLVPMILNFITVPIIMGHLGTESYGIQSLATAIISYLMLADVGLDIPIVKFSAQFKALGQRKELSQLLSTTFWLYIGIGTIMGLGLILAAPFLSSSVFQLDPALVDDARRVFMWTGAGFLALMLNMWGQSYLKGLQRYGKSNTISILMRSIGALTGLGLVLAGYGIVAFIAARIIAFYLGSILFLSVIYKEAKIFPWTQRFSSKMFGLIKGHMGYGFLLRVTSSISSKLDQLLLGAWASVALAGLYAVPVLACSSLSALISSLIHFSFPKASSLQSQGLQKEIKQWFIRISKLVVLASCVSFIPLIAIGRPVLTLWVGAEIAEQTHVVLWIVGAATFINVIVTSTVINFMVGIGRIKDFTIYAVTRAVLIALGMVILIPEYDIIGAAWALCVSIPVDVVFLIWSLCKHLRISIGELMSSVYLIPLLISGALGYGLFACSGLIDSWWTCILAVAAYVIAFGALLLILRFFSQEERDYARSLFRRKLS